MKKLIALAVFGIFLIVLAGCEWTGGGGVDSWDNSGNWVDFSGTYKASGGGILVRTFGTGSTNMVSDKVLARADGKETVFGGCLEYPPLSGSLTIRTTGGHRLTDPGGADSGTISLTVYPSDGTVGTLNLDTGAWTLNFPAALVYGTEIRASYTYVTTSNPSGNTSAYGKAIYSFVLFQTGNKLQITDSNGALYEGTMGSVRTSGGVPVEETIDKIPPTDGPVEAQFSVTGTSAGYSVEIVGVLQGSLSDGNSLQNRTMMATFIEEYGYVADVSAVSADTGN